MKFFCPLSLFCLFCYRDEKIFCTIQNTLEKIKAQTVVYYCILCLYIRDRVPAVGPA